MSTQITFADSGFLSERICHASKSGERIAFLVGSALTAPGSRAEEKGVPTAEMLVQEVIQSFKDTDLSAQLDQLLRTCRPPDRYQEAMRFIIDARGQDTLNRFVQQAVLKARIQAPPSPFEADTLERDTTGWHLRPAVEALGSIISKTSFDPTTPILTSNFDPLLEISIRRSGGQANSIFLSADGQFTNIISPGAANVVHFHGYWREGDTLHTPTQLTRDRPHLKGCLRTLLRNTTLVVMGYGGWSDVFTRTLLDVIREQTERLNVLWCFYSDSAVDIQNRNDTLLRDFESLAGQRVVFYRGIDCHIFLPRLRDKLLALSRSSNRQSKEREAHSSSPKSVRSTAEGSDHPPQSTVWVGREAELRQMLSTPARVIAITGIGGNGKSTLAAKYLNHCQSEREMGVFFWADCREQANTLHNHLVRIVERASLGKVSSENLKDIDTNGVIDVLFETIKDTPSILVFDNIDQYINVEECRAVGVMDQLLDRALAVDHKAQFILTGRPKLLYPQNSFLAIPLEGLTLPDARRLFAGYGIACNSSAEIGLVGDAHFLTGGHPLALSLIATQVAVKKTSINEVISKLKKGLEEGLENPLLHQIWRTLNLDQQTALRYLAELVAPEPQERIGSYLAKELNYNQFSRAIRNLKGLNLIVIKSPGGSSPETMELHPLVRDFVRRKFPPEERDPYIKRIIIYCDKMIGKFRTLLDRAPYSVLGNWTSKIELCVHSGRCEEALDALFEVYDSLRRQGYGEEFVRLAVMVFEQYRLGTDEKAILKHDELYTCLSRVLSELGRFEDADGWLQKFEGTVVGKTARFVLLCDMRAYSLWMRSDLVSARAAAMQGIALKTNGGLDTQHDCGHTLALIQRDSGEVEPALKFFLRGESIESVLDPKVLHQNRGGHFYGNIGRCLVFQGKNDAALICLRKSASILEKSHDSYALMNRGWATFWIADVFRKLKNWRYAYALYRCAFDRWRLISPPRSKESQRLADECRREAPEEVEIPGSDFECERMYLEWVEA